jgi:hypothetical protein
VNNDVYFYNLGGGGYDEIRRIDLRYEVGPGVGYRFVQTKPFQLSAELGGNYQVEDRSRSKTVERFYYRLANFASWKVSARLTLDEKFEFFPEVDSVDRYRIRLEANARYLLAGNISFLVTILDQYDTDPARNVDHNDLQLRSAIGVKF